MSPNLCPKWAPRLCIPYCQWMIWGSLLVDHHTSLCRVDAERRALQRRVQLFMFNKMGQWNNKKWWIILNNYIITILNYQSAIGVPWCTQFWPIACDVEVSYVGYPKSSRLWGIYALFNGELRNYCDLRVSQPHDIRYWNIKHVDACGKLLSWWFKQQRLKIVIADRIYITRTGPATIT